MSKITNELRQKMENLSTDLEIGLYSPDIKYLSNDEAKILYQNKDKHNIPDHILYFYLNNDDKLNYIDDVKYFWNFEKSLFFLDKDVKTLTKIYEKLLENENFVSSGIYKDIFYDIYDEKIVIPLLETLIRSRDIHDDILRIVYDQMNIYGNDENISKMSIEMLKNRDDFDIKIFFWMVEKIKNDETLIEVLNEFLKKDDKFLKQAIELDCINSCIKHLPEDIKKEIIFKLAKVEDVKVKDMMLLISSLNFESIKEYLKKDNLSEENIVSLSESLRTRNWNDPNYTDAKNLFYYLDSSNENRKYITSEYLITLANVFQYEELLKITEKYVMNDGKTSALEKCQMLYQLFDEEELLGAIDMAIPMLQEKIHPYLGELMAVITEDVDIKKFTNVKEYLIKKYKITNIKNFDDFFDKFGYKGVAYLNSDNIVNLINLDTQNYNKMVNLFSDKNTELNMNVINTLVNSFLQREFRLKCSDIYNVFSTFETLLQNPNEKSVKEIVNLLNKINVVVNAQGIVNMDMKTFVKGLIKHDSNSINALHNLTNAYIAKEREIYVSNNLETAMDRLYIEKYYNKSYLKKHYISDESEADIEFTLSYSAGNHNIKYEEDELELLNSNNNDLLRRIIAYKKNPKNNPIPSSYNKYLKTFESILNKLYDARVLNLSTIPADVKYDYFVPKIDKERMLSILSNINIDHTIEKIINNDALYSRLDKFIEKYKLLGWSNIFDRFAATTDMNLDETMPSALITYFDKIGSLLPPNATLTDVIDYANAYSGFSNKYFSLIKSDNFSYISANPGPNQASTPKSTRIGKIPYFVKQMYQRDSITIPSGETQIELNGKKVNISVGDIYDPIALTYGERTGACLRIGGAFEDLYSYCLSDKNGFHIRFTNPKTGELITRVSGIRNGNTVFLNELRTSLSEEYSDDEIAQILHQVAKQMVLSTKDDPHPIENVIVSNDYAMSNQTSEDLMITDTNAAFKGINFNIHGMGHVLYTASNDHKSLIPYKFGDEYTSQYKPYNDVVHQASYKDAKEAIERVIILDQLLKGIDFEDVEFPQVSELITDCIYGNGWACYIDENGKLHQLVIDKFKNDKQLMKVIEDGINQHLGGVLSEQTNRKNS